MKRVFILGAGASRELYFSTQNLDIEKNTEVKYHKVFGPLSSGFFYYSKQFMEEIKKISSFSPDLKFYNKWLIDFIQEYSIKEAGYKIDISRILQDEDESKKINIEKLYVDIDNKLKDLENKRQNKFVTAEEVEPFMAERELLKIIHGVFSSIAYFCYSRYHRILANYLIKTGGNVISFNWDILLEEELFDTGGWDYVDGYGFKPAGFFDKNKELGLEAHEYKCKGDLSSNIVFKPHGSINWYKKRIPGDFSFVDEAKDIYIGIPLTRKGAFRGGIVSSQGQLGFVEIKRNTREQFESLMLPPGIKRRRFNYIWSRVRSLLEEAEEIISVGFSFNEFDSHIVEEFNGIKFKDELSIKLVNPEIGIEEKYKRIFKTKTVSKICNNFSEYCKWIVSQKDMGTFADLIKP